MARMLIEDNIRSNQSALEEMRLDRASQRDYIRREQEEQFIDRRTTRNIERRGQLYAFFVAFGGFAVCTVALYLGFPTAATTLGCTMIVALVGAFLFGRTKGSESAEGANGRKQ